MIRLALSFAVIFLTTGAFAQAATVTNKIVGAKLSNVVIAKDGYDPCLGKNVGDVCDNGVLYAGTGFAGLGSYKYMTTPGNCTDSVTPTCNGSTDTLVKKWANNSGTTAYGVSTGATSATDGASNTTLLATSYTDTDAAKYCENMVYGSYGDWYLPAKDELNLVLYSMKVAGKGNFDISGGGAYLSRYWSSTESSNVYYSWYEFFDSGSVVFGGTDKLSDRFIRCVRKY